MNFCGKCGAARNSGRFCAQCGTPSAPAPPARAAVIASTSDDDLAEALRQSLLESEQSAAQLNEDAELQRVLKLSLFEQSAAKGHGTPPPSSPPNVFLFVSRTSGGNVGQRYLDLCSEHNPAVQLDKLATVWIYDIARAAASREGGFEKVIRHAKRRQAGELLRVIACGGDGTVSWMVSELRRRASQPTGTTERNGRVEQVLDAVVFGVLPLGTGNDFSRTFNWGGTPPDDLTQSDVGFFGLTGGLPEVEVTRVSLQKSVRQWLTAEVAKHDLWTVEVRASEGGDFMFVQQGAEVLASSSAELQARHHVSLEPMAMRKPLLNYFSFGYESKVGFEFDKHRTGSADLNKLVYGVRGLWEAGKAQVGGNRAAQVRAVLNEMAVVERLLDGAMERRNVIVTTLDAAHAEASRMPSLGGDPLNLLMMNTKTIVKGKDVWGGTREVLHVDARHVAHHHTIARESVRRSRVRGGGGGGGGEQNRLTVVEVEEAPADLSSKEQQLGDGKVYFVTYEDIASFVGDIAHAELFGAQSSRGQRLWYGPDSNRTRPGYDGDVVASRGDDAHVVHIELAFKEAKQALAQVATSMLAEDGHSRGNLIPRGCPARQCIAESRDLLSRDEAERAIATLQTQFPAEAAYLRALRAAVQQRFPEYCNRNQVVYMQIDGEYFAVRWPRSVRVVYDVAVNVLRNAV